MNDIKLSENFRLSEFTRSATATAQGIDNTPDIQAIVNLCALCHRILEPLRKFYGRPITINSGYRSPELNSAVGGAKNSYHLYGRAADIPMKPCLIAYIRDHLPYKELINEGGWIHVAV